MFKWFIRLVVLTTAYILISFGMYIVSWDQPDMTQPVPSSPGFARCDGPDCLTSHPERSWP
jgi:hypothetical protein